MTNCSTVLEVYTTTHFHMEQAVPQVITTARSVLHSAIQAVQKLAGEFCRGCLRSMHKDSSTNSSRWWWQGA